ncbi:MAG: GntR family transcriptional regulator [Geminicoccaceae bacterium]
MAGTAETLRTPGESTRLVRHLSTADRIHDDLRRRIIALELQPGSTLHRNELARAYGVSQTPLRDAMQRLAEEGLLDIFRQSRTIVSLIDTAEMAETQFLRMSLETELVGRLSVARPPDVLGRLRSLHGDLHRLVGDLARMERFDDIDRAFHMTMYDACGMGGLHAMLQARSGHLMRIRRLELPMEGKMRVIAEEHAQILEAIEAGAAERARDALRAHISGAYERVSRLKDRFPHFFTSA